MNRFMECLGLNLVSGLMLTKLGGMVSLNGPKLMPCILFRIVMSL